MTKEQRDWLISNNLDPEVYDIDADGNVFENPVMGKLEAGARSAAASAIPSIAGIPGAVAGGKGGALLGAPFGPVGVALGTITGGLVGGLTSSYATSKAQEALLEKYSPETLQKLAQAQEEQPVSSYIGGFAPTALTARPSLKGLSELGRPLVRQTTLREAITKPGFVEPAMNVAANVAQATGQQIADVTQGGEFSGGRLAADIALGTLFNRPTRLGRKLGLAEGPQEAPVQELDLEASRVRAGRERAVEEIKAETPPTEFVQPREERLGIGQELEAPEQFFGTEMERRNRPVSEERMAKQYENWWKSQTEPTETLIKEAANSVKVRIPKERIQELANDPDVARVINDPTTLPEFISKQYQEGLEDAYESISKINETSDKLIRGLAEEQMGEIQRSLARKKEAETIGFRDILPKANDAAQEIYDTINSRLQRQGEVAKITQADVDAAARIAARRGLTIELDRPFAGSTEIRGMYIPDPETGNRIVRVNPLMATADTAIHEIGHDVFRGVTNPSMRKSLLESAQESQAYKDELLARSAEVEEGKLTPKQAQDIALEEGLIQAFGEQIPNIRRSDIRAWFSAFKASTKQLITGKISPEDAIAWMHYATTESVPWKGVAAPKAGEERMQREPVQQEIGRNIDFAKPPTEEKAIGALSSSKQPFWRQHDLLPEGTPVGVRIDIPAFLNKGTYVQTIHEPATPGNVGDRIGYDTNVRLAGPVKFFVKEGSEESKLGAVAIKEGRAAKHPIATVEGRLIKDRSIPADIETWTPVGMDPKKHSYFYDKRTDRPVVGGSESFSVGNTVFVKDPVYGRPQDFRFQRGETKTRQFAGRVSEAEAVPEEVRQTVAGSPEAQYEQQKVADVVDRASAMSLSELNADLADVNSNTRVASGMEIFSRQINSGDMLGASKTALALAKSGTTWGQLINQFKLLKSSTPEGLVKLVQDSLAAKKRPEMTQQQAAVLMDAATRLKLADEEVLAAGRNARDAFASNDVAAINQSIKQLDLADAKRSEIDVLLNETISKINPAEAADLFISMVQGSVMGPISIVRNVVGNAINYPLRELGDIGAAAIDATFSKDKNNSFNIRARTTDRIKAIERSLPAFAKTLLKGSNAMPYEVGTDSGNPLNFQRAWRRIAEDFAAGKIGSALSARNLTEASIGILPDIMLRLTQATDIPFRQAERARIIGEIGRQKGLSESQIQIAMRDPKLAFITDAEAQRGRRGFTEDDLATIETESAKAIFQQDNKVTQAVAGINRFIKKEFGSTGYIPYRLISLFQKTPINVAAEALQFTPAGALQDWGNMTPRERNIAASRLAVGLIATTAFSYLYHKGVIAPNLDTPGETNKARELAKAGGVMPPGTINLSAVKRLVNGGSPKFQAGDTVVDLSSLGTAGALGIMTSTALRQAERGRSNEEMATALFKAVPTSGLNFVLEQQFLKGTSDFIKLLSQESTVSLDRLIKNYAVTAASPVAPAILGSIRRAEREKLPAIGGQSFIKDTIDELNQRYAALGLAIPGAKDPNAMPVRRDLWGQPVEQTPKGSNPWVYQFFNAWKARDIDADPLNTAIYTIWRRTADNSAIPSVPNPSLTYRQKTYDRMTPEQFDRYSELVGNYRRLRAEQEFMRSRFQQGGDERKLKLLQRAYDDGLLMAKKQFMRELAQSGQSLTPLAARRGFREVAAE